jgi:hypothetical protein
METLLFHVDESAAGGKNIPIFFERRQQESAEHIHRSLAPIIDFICSTWGLEVPQDFRVYIMTSMLQFIFHPASLFRKIVLGLFLPLWYGKAKKVWGFSGGWSLPVGKSRVIGVKPPELWPDPGKNFGIKVFVDEPDSTLKFNWFLCHETVHAFSLHLRLPLWLNEGIAAVSVDRLYQRETIRRETLDLFEGKIEKDTNMNYRSVQRKDKRVLLYHFVRGYWFTRYLEEKHPGLVKSLLKERQNHQAITAAVEKEMDLQRGQLWQQLDAILSDHFR